MAQSPTHAPLHLSLSDAAAATDFARLCAQHLGAGATVLLSGPIGAGKSHFARVVIRHFLGAQTEVPSPTFTLVQTYEGPFDIWHADLYRLTHAGELGELGLDDALGRALCLIEWPDRVDARHWPPALCITLSHAGDGRLAEINGAAPALALALRARFATP